MIVSIARRPLATPLIGADAVAEAPDGAICVSAGNKIWRLSGAGYQDRAVLAEFDSDVGALTFDPEGRLLACTARGLGGLGRRRQDDQVAYGG